MSVSKEQDKVLNTLPKCLSLSVTKVNMACRKCFLGAVEYVLRHWAYMIVEKLERVLSDKTEMLRGQVFLILDLPVHRRRARVICT